MRLKRTLSGSVMGLVGFLLSPLSWWNDAFVNLPLAIGFGWIVSLAYRPAFDAAVIFGYWLTNVLGFVLMHKAAAKLLSEEERRYGWRVFGRDVAISMLYTAFIVVLLKMHVLQPIENYFPGR